MTRPVLAGRDVFVGVRSTTGHYLVTAANIQTGGDGSVCAVSQRKSSELN